MASSTITLEQLHVIGHALPKSERDLPAEKFFVDALSSTLSVDAFLKRVYINQFIDFGVGAEHLPISLKRRIPESAKLRIRAQRASIRENYVERISATKLSDEVGEARGFPRGGLKSYMLHGRYGHVDQRSDTSANSSTPLSVNFVGPVVSEYKVPTGDSSFTFVSSKTGEKGVLTKRVRGGAVSAHTFLAAKNTLRKVVVEGIATEGKKSVETRHRRGVRDEDVSGTYALVGDSYMQLNAKNPAQLTISPVPRIGDTTRIAVITKRAKHVKSCTVTGITNGSVTLTLLRNVTHMDPRPRYVGGQPYKGGIALFCSDFEYKIISGIQAHRATDASAWHGLPFVVPKMTYSKGKLKRVEGVYAGQFFDEDSIVRYSGAEISRSAPLDMDKVRDLITLVYFEERKRAKKEIRDPTETELVERLTWLETLLVNTPVELADGSWGRLSREDGEGIADERIHFARMIIRWFDALTSLRTPESFMFDGAPIDASLKTNEASCARAFLPPMWPWGIIVTTASSASIRYFGKEFVDSSVTLIDHAQRRCHEGIPSSGSWLSPSFAQVYETGAMITALADWSSGFTNPLNVVYRGYVCELTPIASALADHAERHKGRAVVARTVYGTFMAFCNRNDTVPWVYLSENTTSSVVTSIKASVYDAATNVKHESVFRAVEACQRSHLWVHTLMACALSDSRSPGSRPTL